MPGDALGGTEVVSFELAGSQLNSSCHLQEPAEIQPNHQKNPVFGEKLAIPYLRVTENSHLDSDWGEKYIHCCAFSLCTPCLTPPHTLFRKGA